jgi:hypothetical protein
MVEIPTPCFEAEPTGNFSLFQGEVVLLVTIPGHGAIVIPVYDLLKRKVN